MPDPVVAPPGAPAAVVPPVAPVVSSRPEYVPEQFWDAATGSPNIQALGTSYAELRGKLSTRNDDALKAARTAVDAERLAKRPAAATDYKVALPKGVLQEGDTFEFDEKNPLIGWWRNKAHGLGLGQDDFAEGISAFLEGQGYELPDPTAEMKLLGENGKARLQAVDGFFRARLSPAAQKALDRMTSTAAGIAAFEEIMEMTGDHRQGGAGGSPFGIVGTARLTMPELQRIMKTPEYYDRHKRDPAVVKRVTDGMAALHSAKTPARK